MQATKKKEKQAKKYKQIAVSRGMWHFLTSEKVRTQARSVEEVMKGRMGVTKEEMERYLKSDE